MNELIAIYHCCRDWPVYPFLKVGRCGFCHEVPEPTGKTLEEYENERANEGL